VDVYACTSQADVDTLGVRACEYAPFFSVSSYDSLLLYSVLSFGPRGRALVLRIIVTIIRDELTNHMLLIPTFGVGGDRFQ